MNQKNQTSNNFDWNSFPPFVGFAVADETSVRKEDGMLVMDYHIKGRKVMQIKLSDTSAEISDWWEGQRIRLSNANTLQLCVYLHYSGIDQNDNPIHKEWVSASVASGNILVRYIYNDPFDVILYPEAFLTDIYIPLPASDISGLENIMADKYVADLNAVVKKGTLNWVDKEDKKLHKEPLNIIRISCPVAIVPYLIGSVKEWIYPGRMWRAFTTKHDPDASSHVEMFFGSDKEPYLHFSLLVAA